MGSKAEKGRLKDERNPNAFAAKRAREQDAEVRVLDYPVKRKRLDLKEVYVALPSGTLDHMADHIVVDQVHRWTPIPGCFCTCILYTDSIPDTKKLHSKSECSGSDAHHKHAYRHTSGAYQLLELPVGSSGTEVLYWADHPWKPLPIKQNESRMVVRFDLSGETSYHGRGADWLDFFLDTMKRLKIKVDKDPSKLRLTQVTYEKTAPSCYATYEFVVADESVDRIVLLLAPVKRITIVDQNAQLVSKSRGVSSEQLNRPTKLTSSPAAKGRSRNSPSSTNKPSHLPQDTASSPGLSIPPEKAAKPRVNQVARKTTRKPGTTSRHAQTRIDGELDSAGSAVALVTPSVSCAAGDLKPGGDWLQGHSSEDKSQLVLLKLTEKVERSPGTRAELLSHFQRSMAASEPHAPAIGIINDVDDEPCPKGFHYTNNVIYGEGVAPLDIRALQGCNCEGPCSPRSQTCSCVRRQAEYLMADQAGFQHSGKGELLGARSATAVIIECNPACKCSEHCQNRVIQRGRTVPLKIVKTEDKGWGVFAGGRIMRGTFVGLYSGEMIVDGEAEERGVLYDQLGRTYFFNLDFTHVQKYRQDQQHASAQADPTLPHRKRRKEPGKDFDPFLYVMDGFKFGNFTRLINHSCEPNLSVHAAYVEETDIDKPLMVLYTNRDVVQGEELTISYFGSPAGGEDQAEPGASPAEHGRKRTTVDKECLCRTKSCKGYMFNLS